MEPSRLLVSPERPDMTIFQPNLQAIDKDATPNILPELLFKYYDAEKLSPLLPLAPLDYLYAHTAICRTTSTACGPWVISCASSR